MTAAHSLTFLWLPWSVFAAVVVVAATSVLSFVAWRRSGYRRDYGLLELLRLTLVMLVAILFNQPEWVEEYRPEERPTIAVLWDASTSMDTRDVQGATASPTSISSRREAVAPLVESTFWESLRERLAVEVQPISAKETAQGTNLYEPLINSIERYRNLRGIVLASDGDWNEGQPPVQAATALRLQEVPVFVVPVGSAARLPDVELLSLDAPTFGLAGKSVRIPFTIESTLPREQISTVTLKTSDGDEVTKEVRVAPMGRTSDWVIWKPKAVGDYTLALDVPPQAEELLADNNRLVAPISIREEKLRVLLVESVPRWEYRYLRNALSRDPGVELSCLLFHPGLNKVGGGNKDYIKQFPQGLDELSKFDVVFLGDVGLEEGQLTSEDCRLLKGIVEHQASGLVFMPGWQGRQNTLTDSELGDLCPVVLDPAQPGGWGSRTASTLELTETGRRSLLTKLADTQDDNTDVWENLPGFQWHAAVKRAKAGSEVLCVHKDAANEFGRLPLLVTRTFGAGKVLFMGTDGAGAGEKGSKTSTITDSGGRSCAGWPTSGTWRRARRCGCTTHPSSRKSGKRSRSRPTWPSAAESRSRMATSRPVSRPRRASRKSCASHPPVTSGVPSPRATRRMSRADTRSRLPASKPARRSRLRSSCKGPRSNGLAAPLRPEVLEEIARVTRGKVIRPDRLEEVVASLAALPDPPAAVRRVQLWCHPAVMGLLVTLLGIFWVGRKAIGLV